LDSEEARLLLASAPTQDEFDQVIAHPDRDLLGKAEKFVLLLSAIPRLEARLQALVFKSKFAQQLDELTPSIAVVKSSGVATTNSQSMKF
jgi:ribosomal protein S4